MKYMLLIYLNEQTPLSEVERQDCYAESAQLAQELHLSRKVSERQPAAPDYDGDQCAGA